MAISSTVNSHTYVGDGTSTVFTYTFDLLSTSDVVVSTFDYDTDAETELSAGTDFVVDDTEKTVTLTTAPATSDTVLVRRVLSITQPTDIKNGGSFMPSVLETSLDRLCMIDQQQQYVLNRCVTLSPIEDSSFDPTLPAGLSDNPTALIVVNDAGTGFEIGPTASDVEDASAGADAAEEFASSCEAYAEAAALSESASSGYAASAEASSSSTLAYYSKIAFVVGDTVSTSSSISDGAQFVPCDPSGGTVALMLPYSSDNPDTRIIFKNITNSTNVITIEAQSGDDIDGSSTFVIASAYGYVAVVGDGATSWWVIQ